MVVGVHPPPPKPSALRLLEGGNLGRRPLPQNEPQPPRPVEVPAAPAYVSGHSRIEWERVIGDLCSTGVYSNLDQTMLAAYCMAYGRWRLAEDVAAKLAAQDPTTHGFLLKTQAGNVIQNPAIGIANVARRDMLRLAAEFGLTPSSRVALNDAGPEPYDPIARKYGL